jgi:serine/threonine protein kinase
MGIDMSQQPISQRYHVLNLIDEGSMGKVYRAIDRLTGNTIALKSVQTAAKNLVFASRGANDQNLNLALASEFKVLASLRHPNIVGVKDYGFDSNRRPYFTMDLLENARTILEVGQSLSLPDQVKMIGQLLLALSYLHRRGFLHRDLKPSNILISAGQVKVLDFGLSVALEHSQTTSGTLAYLAPEILLGEPASTASDLYAVGVILYQLVMGTHPFLSENAQDTTHNILYTNPLIDPNRVSDTLAIVLKRLLAKKPAERYSDTRQVMHVLSQATKIDLPVETLATRESFLQASRFIGREQELSQLTTALDNTFAGQGSAWFIGGESGVGKSRLLDEISTQALVRGTLVLRGQPGTQGAVPFAAWQNPLRLMILNSAIDDLSAGVLMNIIPDISSLLGREIAPAPAVDSTSTRNRLVNVIDRLFQAQQQPCMLLLEDLEWAVEDVTILQRLLSRVNQLPLLIIAAFRTDDQRDLPDDFRTLTTVKHLTLAPFSHEQVAELGESMLGSVGRYAAVIELLQRETEGNAFFLVEVIRALAEDAGRLSDIGKKELPHKVFAKGIEQAVQRRLERVPAASRLLLAVAAAIGRELDPKVLEATHLSDNLNQWLERCGDAAVLEIRDERWRFSHDKLRDGILGNLSGEEAQSAHQIAALALEAVYDDDSLQSAALAYHWQCAGDALKERQYTIVAAKQANDRGFLRDSSVLWERVIVLCDPTMETDLLADANCKLGNCYEQVGQVAQALPHYQKSLDLARQCHDLGLIAESLRGVGTATYRMKSPIEAVPFFLESLALSRQDGNRLAEAKTLGSLGSVHYFMGQLEPAADHIQSALRLFQDLGNLDLQSSVMSNLSVVLNKLGRFAEGVQIAQEAVVIARQIGNRKREGAALSNLAMSYFDLGYFEDSIAALEQGLVLSIEVGDHRSQCIFLNNIGTLYIQLGQLKRATTYFKQSLLIPHDSSDQRSVAESIYSIGKINMGMGKVDEALDHFNRALSISRELNDREKEGLCLVALGSAYSALNDSRQALKHLQTAVTIADEIGSSEAIQRSHYQLSKVYLSMELLTEALQEILMVRSHQSDTEREKTLVLHGLIALCCGNIEEAKMAAENAVNFARDLIAKTPGYYSAYYALALATALQAILAGTEQPNTLQSQAGDLYRVAIRQCGEAGIVAEERHLLESLRQPTAEDFIASLKVILA